MEKYFKRKSEKTLARIDQKIQDEESKIKKANNNIEALRIKHSNESKEYFNGNHIISEEEDDSSYGIQYHIAIHLSSLNVRVDVHPDSITLGKTYVAILCEYGANDGSLPFIDSKYPCIRKGIGTFEDAKKLGLGWLKDLIEIDNVKKRGI